MTKFLYTNFLDNKNVYNLAQASWNRLLSSVLKTHGYTHSPYINQVQNGEKEYDGNPIFSAFIPEIGRAIRIIQVSPLEEGDHISAWIDTINMNEQEQQTEELVLDIKLSRDARIVAKKLIKQWIEKQLDPDSIEMIVHE